MKLSSLSFIAFTTSLAQIAAEQLRGKNQSNDHPHRRQLNPVKSSSCTLLLRADLLINPGSDKVDHGFECEMDSADMNGISNLSLPIQASDSQKKKLKALLESGDYKSGEASLKLNSETKISSNHLFLPPGLQIVLEKKPSHPHSGRKLAIVTGVKPILVVKVKDVNGLERSETPAQIGDNVFGTNGDPVNLKSQLYDCSMTKLNVTQGDLSLPNGVPNGKGDAPGVMQVTISVSLEGNSRSTIRNAVTTAVQNAIGENLPGRYQQVMYVLEGCYQDCGWAAYAYINSWNSVYQGNYYYMTGVQVHELGHNFNLAHSGGLDGQTYTDHTGMMGNPLYSDDVGKMCFNAAKNWQIGWYNDRRLLINPISEPTKTVTLVGIAEYLKQSSHPVVVKLETGLPDDYFVGFNRAILANAQNDEGDNLVTVIQVNTNNGEGYSQSYLKAKLGFAGDATGTSYTITNFGGTGVALKITVLSIDLTNSDPATATVKFEYLVTNAPTKSPVVSTSTPTSSPIVVTSSPTKSPVTSSPTKSPVVATSTPTKSPVVTTSSPTKSPVAFDSCTLYTKAKECKDNNCLWLGSSTCVSSGGGPSPPSPPTSPPPSPPTGGGVCSSSSCSSCSGGGECKSVGCSWSKGTCS